MSWNDGYFTDATYLGYYFANLNPLLLNLNLTFAGIDTCDSEDISVKKDISYLELGFGKGNSLALHAIANEGVFSGTDFLPSHALHAQKMVQNLDMGTSLNIYNDSFKELLEKLEKENASFDYIVMHGVYSWVSVENQNILLEIVRKFLKVGGIVYISYNCLPGWDGKWSGRKLLTLYKDQAKGNAEEKMRSSMEFFKNFLKAKPSYLEKNPQMQGLMELLETSDISYIAHEFFNKDSSVLHFVDMVENLQSCKCEFGSSANIRWHFAALNSEIKECLNGVDDPILKEQLKDYALNTQFRTDIFIKGKANLTQAQIFNRFLSTHFSAINILNDKKLDKIYHDIFNYFAKDNYRRKTAKELHENFPELSVSELATVIAELIGQGVILPAKSCVDDKIKQRCQAFNKRVLESQYNRSMSSCLASAYNGGGVVLSDLNQIFLLGYANNVREDNEYIEFAYDVLMKRGDSLRRDGKTLNEKQHRQELKKLLVEFKKLLPIYNALELLEVCE